MKVTPVAITLPLIEIDGKQISADELMAYVARVSNPKNQENLNTMPKLLRYCADHKHWSVFEQADMTVEIQTTRAIAQQILRHRSFCFQEFCISGDSKISCITPGGKVKLRSIKSLYYLQKDIRWSKLIRTYDKESNILIPTKIKEVFKTGIKSIYCITLDNGKKIKTTLEHKFLTKNGFVSLQELKIGSIVGCNGEPVYKNKEWLEETKKQCHKNKTSSEIKETIYWSKISNIEFIGEEMTYDIEIEHKSHNYIANGIIVHNSQRYAKALDFEVYEARRQDDKNRQNSIDDIDDETKTWFRSIQRQVWETCRGIYEEALKNGIAKECARFILPLNTKTTLYMKGNVRSWIHYIELRTMHGVQKEHRDISLECKKIFMKYYPLTAQAMNWESII